MKKIHMLLIVALFSLLSCNDKYPELEDGIYAEFITDKGTLVAELFYEDAPATVANFVALAEGTHTMTDSAYAGKPYYNGLKFHRIIKDFMIQGGDPKGTGSGDPGYKFHDEFSEKKHDTVGILSMANSGPNTNGSQFFITHKPTPHLNGRHTVWGETVIGFDVIDSITGVEMLDPRAGKPKGDVFMQQVNIIRKGSFAKKYDAPATFIAELAKHEEKKAAEIAEKAKTYAKVKATFDAKRSDTEKLPSGLEIHWDHKGKGQQPAIGSTFMAHYAGYFASGELFDTSIEEVAKSQGQFDERRKAGGGYAPMQRKYSPDVGLIPGFKEGLLKMSVGDKVTLFIPSHLGYGPSGFRGVIPPNADLVFELEMVGIADEK
ncbi:peptidylprolyl isomerase [Dokdonia sp.]|uniref:peptidylprolyl isomerase n=1 Tax=Dokdonia sp. TaxID=2024995 RepID=UPI003267812C